MRHQWNTGENLIPFDIPGGTTPSTDGDVVTNLDMPSRADLPSEGTMPADLSTPGDADLRDHDGIFTDHHVMGNLHQIVKFDAAFDNRGTESPMPATSLPTGTRIPIRLLRKLPVR